MNATRAQRESAKADNQSDWVKTPVANLVRHKPSGIYFARAKVKGKLFRARLEANGRTVAKLRMILAVVVETAARAANPSVTITKRRIILRELSLPEPDRV